MNLTTDLKKILTLRFFVNSLLSGLISFGVSIYIALCPLLNGGISLTIPLVFNVAKFQLFGFGLCMLLLFFITLTYICQRLFPMICRRLKKVINVNEIKKWFDSI
ncbi:hypothetical protein [Priestia sp. LL-8]|uniref:hypothetical protein n=1 Tax=Priestia sp. LL-8 TaxID=3110068 RepID=UPI002E269C29|nr:hypothetical protein [Priestia sp. LL-8]